MPGFQTRRLKGRGPCSRRQVGQPFRRHVPHPNPELRALGCTFHVTKGKTFWPAGARAALRTTWFEKVST